VDLAPVQQPGLPQAQGEAKIFHLSGVQVKVVHDKKKLRLDYLL
jgi:hypothetical protein